ncbi:MAG: S8 family serine peptidase [Actinobacteria bacterium]|nr:S8 family serine peptidase [Actinomycetota bacterium]
MGADELSDRRYWLSRADQRYGPYTWAELTWFAQSGSIGADDRLWVLDETESYPAGEFIAKFAAGTAPDGGKRRRGSPRARWIVAVSALVVAMVVVVVVRDDGSGTTDTGSESDEVDVGIAEIVAPSESALIPDANGSAVAGDQVLVVLGADADRQLADEVAATVNGEVVGQIELAGIWQIAIPPTDLAGITAIVDTLAANPEVELAVPNETSVASEEIWGTRISPMNDPLYTGELGDGYRMIGLERAWDYLRASGLQRQPVKVGITDSGIYRQGDPTLSEFPERAGSVKLEFPDPTAGELAAPDMHKDATGQTVPYSAERGSHGTGVATTFFGDADNGGAFGVASVLGPDLTVLSTNIFTGVYGNSSWEYHAPAPPGDTLPDEFAEVDPVLGVSYTTGNLKAIADQVRKGARVINMSWGCGRPTCGEATQALYQRFFEQMARRHPKVLFVAAAHNQGVTPTHAWPGGLALPNMITVGNVMNDGSPAASSNRAGPNFEVTLAAPGSQAVRGVEADGTPIATLGGTSNAAPQVSGAAALLLSIKPDLTAAELKQLLFDSARTSVDRSDGTTVDIDAGVGGRVLAVDQAVLKLIKSERLRLGLDTEADALTEEMLADMLSGIGVLDAVAVSDDAASEPELSYWTVTAIVGACATGCTSVTMATSDGVASGNSSQELAAAGELTWSIGVTQYPATLTLLRSDNGAGSRIVIPGPSTEEPPTAPTSTVPPDLELGTGDVQATLIWSGDSDMDLHVVEPNGEEIFYSSKSSSTGGSLDHDDIPACGVATGDHVENIFWPTGQAPLGDYTASVRFYRACAEGVAQSVQLTVRVNGQVVVSEAITLTDGATSNLYTFGIG